MTTFHIGCAGFVRPRAQYQARLRYVEIDLREPRPSPRQLATWRKSSPEGFGFALVAPPTLWGERDWPLRDEAALRSELDRLANQVDALGARVLVFRSPVAVSPGSVALRRFAPVLERARKLADVVVWDPAGLWEREGALDFARPFGAIVAADPLRDPVRGEPVAYARMRGLGSDRTYHADRLEDLAVALRACTAAYVVFESSNAYQEALRFARVADGLPPADEEPAGPADDEDDDDDDDEDRQPGDEDGDDDDEDGDDEEDDDDEEDEDGVVLEDRR